MTPASSPSAAISAVNSGARLDRLPVSWWHYRVAALITAGAFVDLFELYSGGSILAELVRTGWSTLQVNATFLFTTFLGLLCGAMLAGVLGDRYGRRFCYQLNLAVFGAASIAAAFAPSMQILIGLRFVMGLGLGAEVVVGYATLAEFVPARLRGRWVAAMSVVVNASFFVSLAVAYYVIPYFGWRAMFLIPGVAALAIWAARKSMPESPRWLEANGREAEAEIVLEAIEREVSRGAPLPPVDPILAPKPAPHGHMTELFRPELLPRTVVGILINVTIGFTLYGFFQWLPTILAQTGMAFGSSTGLLIAMSLGTTAGALVAMLLSDRLGRKRCIILFSLAAAVCGACLTSAEGSAFVALNVALSFFVGIANTVSFTVYVPELFETRLRLRGTGVCGSAGRLATAGVQFVIVALFNVWGLPAIVALLSAMLVVQALAVAALGPETARQSLERAAV